MRRAPDRGEVTAGWDGLAVGVVAQAADADISIHDRDGKMSTGLPAAGGAVRKFCVRHPHIEFARAGREAEG